MQKRVVEPQADETRTESKVTARAEPSTTHVYKFDRLRNGTKMAEGATISRCSSPEDAQKEAAKLFGNHPYESFVLQEVDGQPVNEPRAEPSRGAADAALGDCLRGTARFIESWGIVPENLNDYGKTHNNALAIVIGEVLDPQDNVPLVQNVRRLRQIRARGAENARPRF